MALDRLAAAGDPQLRRILLYARGRREPFAADEASNWLGVHRTVARNRLDKLVEAGFLDVRLERRSGRRGPGAGRPAKVYQVAPELQGVEFPDRHYADLVGLLLQHVPVRSRERALQKTGEAFGHQLAEAAGLKAARSTQVGLERVCDALGSLGFQVALHSLEGDEAVFTTPTCPLRPLVVQQAPATAIDRGMWAGLVESGIQRVSAANVRCETACCLSEHASCQIAVTLRHQPRS
jgi:predicted ArsR family transcriptional regulator